MALVFLGAARLSGYGQSLQVIRYSEEEGLTNTLVKSVTTDHNGLIWVATDGGLFLFDGREFSRFEGELPSSYVKSVFCRRNGDVLITTDLGVMVADAGVRPVLPRLLLKGSVKQVDSLLWFPKGCYEDAKGSIWMGDNRRIYRLAGSQVHSYFPGEKAVTNNFQRSFSFAEDGFGHLFSFAEPGAVYLFNPGADRFEEVQLPGQITNIEFALASGPADILLATRTGIVVFRCNSDGKCTGLSPVEGSPEVSCLFSYAPGRFFAGTWADGLFDIHRDGMNYTVTCLEEVGEKNINFIAPGAEGTVWIASDNGLILLQQNLFSSPFRQATADYIQCISGTPAGNVFFCNGQKVFCSVTQNEQYPSGAVSVVKSAAVTILQAIPSGGGMWFSDVNAKIWYENPVGKTVRQFDFSAYGRAVFFLKCDRAGNLWACQDQNPALIRIFPGFETKTYGKNDGITSRPLVIALDREGGLFAGGMADSAYLFSYNTVADRFINLSKPLDFQHNIDININDMAAGQDGTVWLASSFGLIKYDKGLMTRVELGPMTGSSVKAVTVDHTGNIWFGNNIGLNLFANNEALSFDGRTGMTSKIINYRCLYIDNANRLWVGTVEGVMVSPPLRVPKKTVTPEIFTILLNNAKEIPFKPSGTIFNDRSFATLKVGLRDYPYINFRTEVFLQGRDTAWQPVPRSGSLIVANLTPGNYTLLLRSKKTGNYLTSDICSWNFTVTRIWYARQWVIALMVVVVLALFWLGLHIYTMNLKRYNERLERAIRERTRETIIQKERIEAQNASILQVNEELKLANISLGQAKERAEEASEAQKKFLSVMTHELRTPLNAVIGAAHLLVRNNPRQDQFEELQILRFSAENLLGLINNILDFTKMESGKVMLEQIDFNLRNLVEEIVSAVKIKAREKNIVLDCQIDEHIPKHLTGDPLRLSQVINNLLGNAMKFTEQGSVGIELRLRERIGNDAIIDFFVRDTGIGMSEEILNNIFETFVQGSSETTRKYGGTGLGLVITRKLLELFGSEIKVKSEPDRGTCFTFSIRFPENPQPPDEDAVDRTTYEFVPFNGQRVLLVEDNEVNKLIASRFLVNWNLTVESASNGLLALEMIQSKAYALVLMDIQMPEMDGYQASAAIRAIGTEPYISIPIIALTAATRSDVSAMIFRSGMNDFIPKPFNPVDLHFKIRKYLGQNPNG